MTDLAAGALNISGESTEHSARVLTPEALEFLRSLHDEFNPTREKLLAHRAERRARLQQGEKLGFLSETEAVRKGDWRVAAAPPDLDNRRVEITGPVDRKMMINALNSGANVFMADLEDALSPTWDNVVEGQANLMEAVRRTLSLTSPEGKHYELAERTATLVVRPRGWHLVESHASVDGTPMSASLFDFGLYFFHNARELIERGTGPYFYLPKTESHLEVRLWNDVFRFAQAALGISNGTIRATVLIETIYAAFEMEEILYELREHAAGLNAGRWDYLFSVIKAFRTRSDCILPDRAQLTMTVPFMRAYTQLLIRTCHKRGAHAIGGMAAFIPSRKDAAVNERALAKVREDKERESADGCDGTWVAHPDLVPVAAEIFDRVLAGRPNQKDRLRDDVNVDASQLVDLEIPGGAVTLAGIEINVEVALQYIEAWLRGQGAVAIHNLMEDAATAEISRSQLWQWVRHEAAIADDGTMSAQGYTEVRKRVLERLRSTEHADARWDDAAALLDLLVLGDFEEFLDCSGVSADRVAHRALRVEWGTILEETRVTNINAEARALTHEWESDSRWNQIDRRYEADEVVRLRGSVRIDYTIARRGAERLWEQLNSGSVVRTFGAMTGAQAVEMVRAGLEAIYLSGWQVAADANLAGQTYPDQSLYPSNSVPALVRRLNNALIRADQVEWAEGTLEREWLVPIVADAEAGFGGPLHAFELMKAMIEAGAAGVHFEDQLSAEKKCGHMGGKVLVPTAQFERTLAAARLASDVLDVPSIIVARTDALNANLLMSDIDERDRPFLTGERTLEGYYRVRDGMDAAVSRARAYARYADVLWCETSTPDLDEAQQFADAIHDEYPGKLLAYNCSPSFNWERKLDAHTIAKFQRELAAMGYAFQFITLAGWHLVNLHTFELAKEYAAEGMPAYVRLQSREFALESEGYTGTQHQREAGTGYFDRVLSTITGGAGSTGALRGSTEAEQFRPVGSPIVGDAAPEDDDVVSLRLSAKRDEIDPPPAA